MEEPNTATTASPPHAVTSLLTLCCGMASHSSTSICPKSANVFVLVTLTAAHSTLWPYDPSAVGKIWSHHWTKCSSTVWGSWQPYETGEWLLFGRGDLSHFSWAQPTYSALLLIPQMHVPHKCGTIGKVRKQPFQRYKMYCQEALLQHRDNIPNTDFLTVCVKCTY